MLLNHDDGENEGFCSSTTGVGLPAVAASSADDAGRFSVSLETVDVDSTVGCSCSVFVLMIYLKEFNKCLSVIILLDCSAIGFPTIHDRDKTNR